MRSNDNGNGRPPAPKCGARTRTGTDCRRPAGWGTAHPGIGRCKLHAGSTPNHVRHAEAVKLRRHAVALGLDLGTGRIDPREALELELWRTHVNVLMYDQLVDELGLDEGGIYGALYHVSGTLTGEAKPHVLVVMRDAERDRLRLVAKECAAAGIEERRIEIEESRAKLIADVFRSVFANPELGLDRERRQVGLRLAASKLRALEAGVPA